MQLKISLKSLPSYSFLCNQSLLQVLYYLILHLQHYIQHLESTKKGQSSAGMTPLFVIRRLFVCLYPYILRKGSEASFICKPQISTNLEFCQMMLRFCTHPNVLFAIVNNLLLLLLVFRSYEPDNLSWHNFFPNSVLRIYLPTP